MIKVPKVCIDPGHGRSDPGAVGNGLKESNLNLAIALHLKPLLIFNGIEVVMTREKDIAMELWSRVVIANNSKCDLFVSVHNNAGGGTGSEVLIIGVGGNAEIAAKKVLPYLVKAGAWANRGVRVQSVYVLKNTDAPAILTESGFVDSVSDADKLKDPAFLHSLAVAHAKGICDYFGITYKEKTPEPVIAPPVPPQITSNPDPDVNLVVWVRTSKIALAKTQINALGYTCEQFPLELRKD